MKNGMHRQVLLLATSQALFQTAAVIVIAIGGLAGAMVASSPALATLPIASSYLGTAAAMFPASLWMARVGRKNGFILGAIIGAAGGLACALGMWLQSLAVLTFGTFLMGVYQAFVQYYRFAASEVATDEYRPRAISLVMAGGVIAAVAGPALARLGSELWMPMYTGSFLLMALLSLVAVGVLGKLDVPNLVAALDRRGRGRPFHLVALQPKYLVSVLAGVTAYGVMAISMAATPLAMVHVHHSLNAAATVIQLHVLGMFAPSFITGRLISRFGALNVMLLGTVFFTCSVLLAAVSQDYWAFAVALLSLGIGWNFLYIGGTSLLTATYRPEERAKAQAANDMLIFAVGLVSAFGSGALLDALGWEVMNLILLPWIVFAAGCFISLQLKLGRQAQG
ncbi:MFS transporter [Pseudomonas putida]|uniref:MFS transporter n=1 Tax=Pseudomonas putida TaxID=303 RepID=UPI002DBE04C3|nr:MFS transporter [Pseudomonas putida]WRW04782.1 MFS transporter [Pseudomonas putida]